MAGLTVSMTSMCEPMIASPSSAAEPTTAPPPGAARPTAALPDAELLEQLRQKLSAPPDCLPLCANLARLRVQAQGSQVQLRLELHALVDSTLRRGALPPQAADVFGGMATAAQGMAVFVTLAVCAWMGWVIRRLMSDAVRQEFC